MKWHPISEKPEKENNKIYNIFIIPPFCYNYTGYLLFS